MTFETPNVPQEDDEQIELRISRLIDHLLSHLRMLEQDSPLYISLSPAAKAEAIAYLDSQIEDARNHDWGDISLEAIEARLIATENGLRDRLPRSNS